MNILLADDHLLLRQALIAVLGPRHADWAFLEAGSFDQALEMLAQHEISLLLLDLNMPGMDGPASVQALREAYPSVRLAVLTSAGDRETILACLAAGAHGFILKSEAAEQLLQAAEQILRGQLYVTPSLAESMPAPAAAKPAAPGRNGQFTPRQMDVLRHLAEGRSTKDIARQLDLGIGTVKVHLAGIYRVLGAKNRTEAVLLASKLDLRPRP